jgi:FlaA1/EpsC-like NDP-sugar epimerase
VLASHHLAGKRILITGAGGSIGSALALAALASSPASLVLLDASESGLYQIDCGLHQAGSDQHIPILGSVANHNTVSHLFEQYQPQIIFHAAALKQVPLMEQNPCAAIENNALGTFTVAQAAIAQRSEQLVLVSTDKAVDPLSIMGASKRIAELVLLTLGVANTRMTAIRLCNVIGSQGSVLPLFLAQIANGGPLTVTHADAQRYFITLSHAVRALFAALQVEPTPALLVPDISAPVRILDLAQHLLQHHTSSASIEFTGLRPGDKLSEQLISTRERFGTTQCLGGSTLHAIESPRPTLFELHTALDELREAAHTHNLMQLLLAIRSLVPEYEPSSVIAAALNNSPALDLTPEMQK